MIPDHEIHGRGIPIMSPGPIKGQTIGTMGQHLTALFPWCGSPALMFEDKTRQTICNFALQYYISAQII